jgi:hypothetical protein
MLGLLVMVAFAFYLTALIAVTVGAGYFVRSRYGWSKKVGRLASFLAFCLMTVPIFWDWLPSSIAYYSYCNNEAGVTQYKTLAQWRAENPGAYENLRIFTDEDREERKALEKTLHIERNGRKIAVLSMTTPRFGTYAYRTKLPWTITKWTTEFIDEEKDELIVKSVEFTAGPGNVLEMGGDSYKIWLNQPYCGKDRAFGQITDEFEKRNLIFDNQP